MVRMTTPRRGPGRPRRVDQRDTADLILEAATALFARRGFDAVGMREVAAAAGVDVATVHHHAGTKIQLYDACFARVFGDESAVLTGAVRAAHDGLALGRSQAMAGLHELLDVFVDFLEDRPQTTGLWLRRWLEPDRHAELEAAYAAPLYRAVEQVLAAADEAGVLHEPLPHVAVRSLVWAVHAHVVSLLAGAGSARDRWEFRAFVHRWLDRMYGAA
jgi:TetR/AcrR family transcriptional regulator, regulator of cefoperazone and chloramphenicol sensitivity